MIDCFITLLLLLVMHDQEKRYLQLQVSLTQQALDTERNVFKETQSTVESLSRQLMDVRDQAAAKDVCALLMIDYIVFLLPRITH